MIGSHRNGVFLSYARKDGEQFATTLGKRLREKAPDIVIRQDRILLEGGIGWWKQLAEAIDSAEFLVLVMTPSAMQSENVRREWRYARQQGICVYPVKAAPDAELNFSVLPRWMSKAHFYDLAKEWETFVAHLQNGCDTPRVPFMAPELPAHFVERANEFQQLKGLLLTPDAKDPVAVTAALSGAGGFGKTTLAAALCHDEDILQSFDDGILWLTLGQKPNLVEAMGTIYAALTGERPGFASEQDAAFQLAQKLEDRSCLLVIDDVWDDAHLRPFLHGGKQCARLFTTRIDEIALSAQSVTVDEMREAESQALLSKNVPELNLAQARALSQRLGEWPIALELASAMIRQRMEHGDTAERAAQRLSYTLDKKGPQGLARGTGVHRTIDAVLESSLELLSSQDRRHLTELSIFPANVPIPLTTAALLWGLDELESEETAQRYARLYLLKLDLGRGSMLLHDVMRSWLVTATANATELHNRLAGAWPDWMQLPDSYAWRWLPWHLAQAGRKAEIEKLLWNPAWLESKLAATDVNALVGDFEYLRPSPEADLIQGALRLSSNVLARDPSQFASQMAGRLLPYSKIAAMQRFIDGLPATADRPWLRPLHPALDSPGTGLLRTLSGHSAAINRVAVTSDGLRAISASEDHTLKVWDLNTGWELRTLAGHSSWVLGVAATPDGQRAVSASHDHTLKVWNLESGSDLGTLVGHSASVKDVAVTPDGLRAISASDDQTLKVWDLETGNDLRTLAGHSAPVNRVAVTPDGLRAISASDDHTLKVWDLRTGNALRTLAGHSAPVKDVALTQDGRYAFSASEDKTIKVWDLESGAELRTLAGFDSAVQCVTLSEDGKRVLSASWDVTLDEARRDRTVKVSDRESGAQLRTLAGHSAPVQDVALTPNDRLAISASNDHTLKVWDLESVSELRPPPRHQGPVNGVAATPDGRFAVSASSDATLKVWDVQTGEVLRTLIGHSGWIMGVAVVGDGWYALSASTDKTLRGWNLETGESLGTAGGHFGWVFGVAVSQDGRRAVSASGDKTLKVWDLEKGGELHTLTGHSDFVLGVAMSQDGRLAVSASGDGTLKVWDLETGTELRTLAGHSRFPWKVVMTPDGRRAVSASVDATLKIWDLETGSELSTLTGHFADVNDVALTSDGRFAVSASSDATLKVWDLEKNAVIATFFGDAAVKSCAFAEERTIIAGDQGGRVYFLSLELP